MLAVGDQAHSQVLFPLHKEPGVNYIHDYCTELLPHAVVTHGGLTIEYDVCVVATGLNYPLFQPNVAQPTLSSRKNLVAEWHDKVIAANVITLAGAGAVGCEVSADIKVRFPDKRVVLIHSRDEILNTNTEALRHIAATEIRKIGVELLLGERLKKFEDGKVSRVKPVTITRLQMEYVIKTVLKFIRFTSSPVTSSKLTCFCPATRTVPTHLSYLRT